MILRQVDRYATINVRYSTAMLLCVVAVRVSDVSKHRNTDINLQQPAAGPNIVTLLFTNVSITCFSCLYPQVILCQTHHVHATCMLVVHPPPQSRKAVSDHNFNISKSVFPFSLYRCSVLILSSTSSAIQF
jgi:hypothetical protein